MTSALHLPLDRLREQIRALAAAPRDSGTVAQVVVRPKVGLRIEPPRCLLTPDGGLDGDRWVAKESRLLSEQVSIMRVDVARIIANGQPLSLFGDNLLVELDLSLDHIPPGTRVRIGEALCEATEKPHTGCAKFAARFGQAARGLTSDPEFLTMRLRGIYVRVVEPGTVARGDSIRIVSEPR